MAGLRKLLMDCGTPTVTRIDAFSDQTKYDMVKLTLQAAAPSSEAEVYGARITRGAMEATGNYSWTVSEEYACLFAGPKVGDLLVGTGGMTIGRNELFVREISDGEVIEPLTFSFAEKQVTLAEELAQARLNRLSDRQRDAIREQERNGLTKRIVVTAGRGEPERIVMPHPDYRFYNKASSQRLYAAPSHAIYWKDDGDAVRTFKKSGPWYLRGVGGGPFFGREGLSWQLVSPKINARYLPPGYILDSGAPCAFLRDGVAKDELWFVLAWLQTALATKILKDVINHTRNIQGKDLERLPYPWWVSSVRKRQAITSTRDAVLALKDAEDVDRVALAGELDDLFVADVLEADAAA
jgi:hypothetical protein